MRHPLNQTLLFLLSLFSITVFIALALLLTGVRWGQPQEQEKVAEVEKYFTTEENYSDIGVLDVYYTSSRPMRLYSAPDESSEFGIISEHEYGPALCFNPCELEALFDPLYFSYSGSYDENGENNDLSNYIIRDMGFRVLSFDDDWIKVVYDEEGSRTCYLKNWKWASYYESADVTVEKSLAEEDLVTWEEWFAGGERTTVADGEELSWRVITNALVSTNGLPLYDRIKGNVIPLAEGVEDYFLTDEVRGEWMHLKQYYGWDWKNPEANWHGWVKWRDGNKILITYVKTFGLV